jgi:hypothetical protein
MTLKDLLNSKKRLLKEEKAARDDSVRVLGKKTYLSSVVFSYGFLLVIMMIVSVLEPLDDLYNLPGDYYNKAVVGKLKTGGPMAGWLWRATLLNQRIDRLRETPLWG